MNDGVYSIMMMIVKDSAALFVLDDAVIFEVHDVERTGNWLGKWPGAVRPKFAWEHEMIPLGHSHFGVRIADVLYFFVVLPA